MKSHSADFSPPLSPEFCPPSPGSPSSPHIPVLLAEILDLFSGLGSSSAGGPGAAGEGGTGYFLDATLGYAGHSEAILRAHPSLALIGADKDSQALAFARARFAPFLTPASSPATSPANFPAASSATLPRVRILKSDFRHLLPRLAPDERAGLRGILADLGVSSPQLDSDERGFGLGSSRLDMRMDPSAGLSAYELVNFSSQAELATILRDFGELRDAKKLAQKICSARRQGEIKSARALRELIGPARVPQRRVSKATLIFQALRIAANDELGALEAFLRGIEGLVAERRAAGDLGRPGLILALISFHSLEDRLVKNYFKKWSSPCHCGPDAPRCECGGGRALGRALTKKPLSPGPAELRANPRSASARLRAFEFLGVGRG